MLNMRRVWRRTSSFQAKPSPWRHCWTSWASSSKLPQPHLPDTCLGSTCRWVFRPANVWNAKCTGNVPVLGPSQPTVWLASYPLPPSLTTPSVTTCWNQIAYPRLTPPLVPRTLLPHGPQVEESVVRRPGYPCGRILALSFSRESPSGPVQRRQALGSFEGRRPALYPGFRYSHLCVLFPPRNPLAKPSKTCWHGPHHSYFQYDLGWFFRRFSFQSTG